MASYKTIRLVCAVCASAAAFSFSAQASTFSNLYVFGDSLSDLGNVYLATGGAQPGVPYSNGRFSNGNLWVQDLAPVLGVKTPTASLAGGTDYAVGGAVTTNNVTAGDLGSQLSAFKAANPVVDPNALYTIWIGSNDLDAILAQNPPLTQAQAAAAALKVVANIDGAITTLSSEGAKNFLVIDVPDLGKTPSAISTGAAGVAAASSLSQFFDSALVNGYSAAGIPSLSSLATLDGDKSMYTLDTYSIIDGITANPGAYGFTNVTQPCLTGAVNYSGGTPCANPNQYLFWDQLHPTAAGQSIVAQDVALVLSPEPVTWTTSLAGGFALAAIGFAVARRRKSGLVD